jgi:transcriptional regulator with XRE-family HTH domain
MRLKELRARQLLTVRELAEQAGISPSTISVIEKGHGRPALGNIRKVSKLFSVDPMTVDEFRAAVEARSQP